MDWRSVRKAVLTSGFGAVLWTTAAAQDNPLVRAVPVTPEADKRADLSEANAALRAADYAKADEVLKGVLVEFPNDPAALLMHGEVLLALGKPAEARPLLERSIELDPARKRAHFQLAAVLQAAGEIEPAIEHFGKEIEVNDSNDVKITARLNRAILYTELGRREEAAAELEAVLVLDPDRPQVYGDLATLYLESGKLEQAQATLDRGFEEGGFSSAHHYYVLGTRYYKDKAYDQAIAAFREALSLQESFADAERSLGAALDQMGQEAEAVVHLERYLALRPDAPEAAEIRERIRSVKTKSEKKS